MVHEKIKDLRDTLVETKTENQSTHEIVKDIRDYLVGEKDELETTNEIVRDIRDELADTQVGITTAEMVKEIHDQIDDPAEAPQTIEEMLGDFQTSLSETETVSGNIVRFDNARALPFKKLNVNFQPKQDGTPWIQDAESEPYIQRAVSVERAGNHISDSIVGGTLAWNQLVKDEEEKEVSGDIATFDDGADGAPMKSVTVTMTPQQDLHGQDAPYPAGGGKNKLDVAKLTNYTNPGNGSTLVNNGNGTITVTATTSTNIECGKTLGEIADLVAGQSYIITADTTASNKYIYLHGGSVIWSYGYEKEITQDMIDGRVSFYASGTQSSATISNLMVRPASVSDATYAPYENICPITGHDSGTVWGTGINVWDEELERGYVSESTGQNVSSSIHIRSKNFIPVVAGKSYYNHGYTLAIVGYGIDKSYLSFIGYINNGRTFTTPNGCYYIKFYRTATTYENDISINYPNSDHDYHAYTGASYHSDFPSTVYGGDWVVTEGEIAETQKCVDMGTLDWAYSASRGGYFWVNLPDMKENGTLICSNYRFIGVRPPTYEGMDKLIALEGMSGTYVDVRDTDYTTIASFKTAMSGVQLCYELATPLTISVDPHTIPSQFGDNNGWSDAGETTVTYLKSTDTLTLKSGRKYLTRIDNTDSMVSGSDQSLTVSRGVDNVFDLTQMFGTAVGDHFYNQGANYFRKYFGKDYYEYCAGELKSVEGLAAHETVGFNQWDEEWEAGAYNTTTGNPVSASGQIRSKNLIPLIPSTEFTATVPAGGMWMFFYDSNRELLTDINIDGVTRSVNAFQVNGKTFTVPPTAQYAQFYMTSAYGATYKNDICINISDPAKNGTYEPYVKHTYPLGNVTLRGIPKLNGNKWYYDGDIYKGSGSVTRKYGIVDLGTLTWVYSTVGSISVFRQASLNNIQNTGANGMMSNGYSVQSRAANSLQDKDVALASTWWSSIRNIVIRDDDYTDPAEFKAAMSGVMLLYELAEPTTESAAKYTSVQIPGTVERYVTSSIVPVGHETRQMDIFPISERNEVTVWKTGRNLVDASDIVVTAQKSVASIVLKAGVYSFSCHVKETSNIAGSIKVVYTGGGTIRQVVFSAGTNGIVKAENVSIATDGTSISLVVSGSVSGYRYEISQIQIEASSTASPYEEHQDTTHIINLGGTYYSGIIDYINGVLTADRVMRTFAQLATDNGWNKLPNVNQFYLRRPSALPNARYPFTPEERPISSVYKYSASGQQPSGTFRVSDALYILDDRFDNVSDFRAALAEMGGGVVYYLAEPITIKLTPQKISTYLGSNTIWSDGDQVEVEYRSKPNRENQENS